ncbi:MAG: PAS domain S-box protein, partial [Bacteroidetes bacterium]|nr:PAS domain S-box protein [Bacteroidota bacterium]
NWQTTFNAIDDIVMLLKPNHDIIDINEAGIIAIGKKREEIIGQKCYKLVHNTDAPIKECSCVNSIKTKEKSVTEIMQNNSNLELLSWPVLDDKNEIKAITHIVKDITSKKQAEEKIQEQNEFLNKIIESLTHPFYVIDANDYTISLANSASGFDSDTKKAKCHSLAHLSDKPCQSSEHPCPMEIVKKSKKPVVVEHIHNDKKGNPRNIEVHGYPIFDKNGKVIKMIEYCLDITERKLAKEALENAEIKFHTLFDTTTDAVMVLDTVNFLDCNPATLNMFGCATVEEFCSKHPADLSPPNQSDGTDSMTLANQRITTAMEKGTNIFEWIHKRADTGETFPAEVILSKMELYGKDVLQATVRDVTERKKMEEELKEREKHLASIIQNPAGYVIYRLKAGPDALSPIVTHVSPSITELTGISPEESKNYKKWFQRVHSGDLSRLIEANERGMKPPFIFEEEFRHNHPSKGLIWLHAKTNGIPYSNDPVIIEWAHGILTDITDRKRADDEIGRMAQMLNVATNAITINDFKGNFLFANQKTYDLHGYSKDQIQALTLDKLYSPDTAKQMPARMKELSEHGKAKFQVEHCTKDGSIIPMEVYAQITKWGETNAILSIATDISERKLAEDEIMQQLTELQ